MRIALAAAAAILAFANGALAQDKAISPEELANARAEADRLIAATGQPSLFENVTDGGAPQIRHVRSGMRCIFQPKGSPLAAHNQLTVFPPSSISAPGDDIGCSMATGTGLSLTHYASRYTPPPTLDEAVNGLNQVIRLRFRDARPVKPATAANTGIDLQKMRKDRGIRTVRYAATAEGRHIFTSGSVVMVGPWQIKARHTIGLEQAQEAEFFGGLLFISAVEDVRKAQDPQ